MPPTNGRSCRARRPGPAFLLVRDLRLRGDRSKVRRGRHPPRRDAPLVSALSPLAPGVYAWLADEPSHGTANAGVIVDEDGITVVDALAVPAQYEVFAA